jgi:outer membrane biosynthesis protein TonB
MGMPVNTSILEQEMAPLNAQIEQVLQSRGVLVSELRAVETELEKFSAARQRFEALQDVCEALDKLGQLEAAELFWRGIPEPTDATGHLEQVRGRISRFNAKIGGFLDKQAALQVQIEQRLDELDYLYEEVRDAHEREERRKEEFVIEREISPLPYRAMVMPWTKEAESEKYFRRLVLVALLICFMLGALVPLVNVPIPDRSIAVVEIPERLAMLVKKEPPKPPPAPKPAPEKIPEETKPKPEPEKKETAPKVSDPTPEPVKVAAAGEPAAPKKAESMGVLAFKNTFKDLMQDTPIAKLGTEARLNQDTKMVKGQAVAQRSLVAMQARSGTSGGISNYGFSRNVGSGNADRVGGGGIGTDFGQVASTIAGRGEAPRPLSDGLDAGRTDEEIQIVFDRYKAALYRIYNTELRKDPTLRGKMLLRISIESGGEVSLCKVESTDLGSPVLVAQIVERILRFNFGPKEGVPKTTILYPIDFLPAG